MRISNVRRNKIHITYPGIVSKAARPAFIDEYGSPKAMSPGHLQPAVVTMCPKTASIAIRPCFTSQYLSLSNLDCSAFFNNPSGSQKPRGA